MEKAFGKESWSPESVALAVINSAKGGSKSARFQFEKTSLIVVLMRKM